MASQILEEFEQNIDDLALVPSRDGVFEVEVGGKLIYSKKRTGRHPEYEEIGPAIRELFA